MNPSAFGVYLRECRTSASKSLREVATHLGISHVYLGEVERGRRRTLPKRHWNALLEILPEMSKGELQTAVAQSKPLDASRMEGAERGVVVALARKIEENGITDEEAKQLLEILRAKAEDS